MSSTVIDLSRRAVRRAMPGATEEQALLRWVELNYGAELARAVAAELARRRA